MQFAEEADEEGFASAMPLTVNGTSITTNRSGPKTKYGRGERWTPTALPTSQIARTRNTWTKIVRANIPAMRAPWLRYPCNPS